MNILTEIDKLDQEKEKYQRSYINKIKKYPYIYLWGISESCDEAIKFFNKHNITIKAIIDQIPDKYNYKYQNIDVIEQPFDSIEENAAYIITISYYETIKNKLITKYKDIEKQLFLFDGYFLDTKNSKNYQKNKEIIENCYKNLSDDKSKKIFKSLLKYRHIRDPKLIINLYDNRKECYLDKVFIEGFKDGLYIDAGSYNADFITTLAEKKPINNSKFYIFEPNKHFYNNIINNLDKKINYKIFDIALCDKDSTMEFMQIPTSTSHIIDKKYNAYKNTITQNDISKVQTNKLDTIIKEEKVQGIKMDVEGAEYSLLKGATRIIKRDKPILLIAIYHKWDDIFKIQNYLTNLNLGYNFYIRHYSLSVAKTVLYCIPNISK